MFSNKWKPQICKHDTAFKLAPWDHQWTPCGWVVFLFVRALWGKERPWLLWKYQDWHDRARVRRLYRNDGRWLGSKNEVNVRLFRPPVSWFDTVFIVHYQLIVIVSAVMLSSDVHAGTRRKILITQERATKSTGRGSCQQSGTKTTCARCSRWSRSTSSPGRCGRMRRRILSTRISSRDAVASSTSRASTRGCPRSWRKNMWRVFYILDSKCNAQDGSAVATMAGRVVCVLVGHSIVKTDRNDEFVGGSSKCCRTMRLWQWSRLSVFS